MDGPFGRLSSHAEFTFLLSVSDRRLTIYCFSCRAIDLLFIRRGHGLDCIQEEFRESHSFESWSNPLEILDASVDDRFQSLLMSLWILDPVE